MLDGRSRETNERSIGKSVPHVLGKTIDEIVLASVGFISNHNDVLSIRENRILTFRLRREELVDRRKDDTTRRNLQKVTKIATILCLLRLLAKDIVTLGKRPEELIVQVVTVCENNHRWILHRRMQNHSAGIKCHG